MAPVNLDINTAFYPVTSVTFLLLILVLILILTKLENHFIGKMPTYKLTYFNVTGLGESIRLLLSYGGQKFEDNRIDKEQWESIKPRRYF